MIPRNRFHALPATPIRVVALFFLCSLWLSLGAFAEICVPEDDSPVLRRSDVRVAFVDIGADHDGDGQADGVPGAKDRNEHLRMSSALADALGVVVGSDDDVEERGLPQVRLLVDTPSLANGHQGTGVFSVVATYPSASLEVEVWADSHPDDQSSGQYRLFEDVAVGDLSSVRVTALSLAPSSTRIAVVHPLRPSIENTRHFCESAEDDASLVEEVHLGTDRRVAVLVPHGGKIEEGTSEMAGPVAIALDSAGIIGTVWDVRGTWHGDDDESEHWHITSKEVGAAAFPGLARIEAGPDFDESRAFQYAVSLHGMKYSKEGILLGGRAHREAKCLIAGRVRERLAAEGQAIPAAYVWDASGDTADSVEVAHGDGPSFTITQERGSNPGLSGTSRANIVNRLSPNEVGTAGFGGIQIEASPKLRDGEPIADFLPGEVVTYRDLVAEAIGEALIDLATRDDLFDPADTAICDALVSGESLPTASIDGRAFWDDDDDAFAGPADRPAQGLTVELLDAVDAVAATTHTDANGRYAFEHLAPGTYRVRFGAGHAVDFVAQNAGTEPDDEARDSDVSTLDGTSAVLALGGRDRETVDAGMKRRLGTAGVGDFVWNDEGSAPQQQDVADAPLAGVGIELFDAAGLLLETQTTAQNGGYHFADLPAGTYALRFEPPAGYRAVEAFQADEAIDSDVVLVDGEFVASVTLGEAEITSDLDAGFTIDCVEATLVAFGSAWRWSQVDSVDWQNPAFDDSAWNGAALGPFGSRSGEQTTVPAALVTYFRLDFDLEDASLFDTLDLSLFREDGAVVYLNGVEVLRRNVPTTETFEDFDFASIDAGALVDGRNVLAVEMHRRGSDLTFDLEVSATVCRPCVERVVFEADRGTYLHGGSSPDLVRGGRDFLAVDSNKVERGLLGWPVLGASNGGLPADAEILHAAILVEVLDDSSERFVLYPSLTDWLETEAHWFEARTNVAWSMDGAADPIVDFDGGRPMGIFRFDDGDFGDPPFAGRIVLNVEGRAVVQDWARGDLVEHGVLIQGEPVTGNRLVIASDDSAQAPRLEVVYRSCAP